MTPARRPQQRHQVGVGAVPGALREAITRMLTGAGVEVVALPPGDAGADDYPVVVTSRRPDPAVPTNVVIYLPEGPESPAARLVTGQWVHLDDLIEVVEFVREITLEGEVRLED